MNLKKVVLLGSLAASALLFSSIASAALIAAPCPSPQPATGRYMMVTADGTHSCNTFGSGNETGLSPLLWKINFVDGGGEVTEGPGPNPFISFTGGTGTSGTFELIAGLTNHLLVFKFGGGGGEPDWFAYNINGITSGSWQLFAISPDRLNGLSHVSIYGPPVEVPEPASLALLGLGLIGVGMARRKRAH